MICPFLKDECQEEDCGLWNSDADVCAILMISQCVNDLSFAADDTNLDCAIRVKNVGGDDD